MSTEDHEVLAKAILAAAHDMRLSVEKMHTVTYHLCRPLDKDKPRQLGRRGRDGSGRWQTLGTTGAGRVIFVARRHRDLVDAAPPVDDLIVGLYGEGLTVTRIAGLCDRSLRFVHRSRTPCGTLPLARGGDRLFSLNYVLAARLNVH